jgi:hypothetical protein
MNSVAPCGLALVALTACSRPNTAPRDHVRFHHGPHLASGLSCTSCHPSRARSSQDRHDIAMPPERQCRACHVRAEQQQCAYCHTAPATPGTYDRTNRELFFSHATHVARVEGNCVACHQSDETHASARFEPAIQDMASCANRCHANEMRAMNCALCHASLERYDVESITLVHHGPGFARHHGVEARAMGATCVQCHEPTFCARCHAAAPGIAIVDLDPIDVTRDFVHRGDFMSRHGDEARFTTATCTRCHGVDFCDGCHRASGVGGGVGPGSTHPPGWLDPASPNGHAREARRNILACASCHESDAAQICTPCHRVGGIAPSPHPPGFRAGIDAMQHAVCLVCHGGSP